MGTSQETPTAEADPEHAFEEPGTVPADPDWAAGAQETNGHPTWDGDWADGLGKPQKKGSGTWEASQGGWQPAGTRSRWPSDGGGKGFGFEVGFGPGSGGRGRGGLSEPGKGQEDDEGQRVPTMPTGSSERKEGGGGPGYAVEGPSIGPSPRSGGGGKGKQFLGWAHALNWGRGNRSDLGVGDGEGEDAGETGEGRGKRWRRSGGAESKTPSPPSSHDVILEEGRSGRDRRSWPPPWEEASAAPAGDPEGARAGGLPLVPGNLGAPGVVPDQEAGTSVDPAETKALLSTPDRDAEEGRGRQGAAGDTASPAREGSPWGGETATASLLPSTNGTHTAGTSDARESEPSGEERPRLICTSREDAAARWWQTLQRSG